MAQNLSVKKSNYLANCVDACNRLKDARDLLRGLKEQWANDVTYSGMVIGDMANQLQLNVAIVQTWMNTAWPAIDAAITAQIGPLCDMLVD
jgi:hypothetical protein